MSIDIPAVVINLARSRDRRTYMEAQLRGRGLDYHFFDATDGTKLTPAERALYDDKQMKRLLGRAMSNSEIACALSHIRVYEWMVKENIERLLVLEDDVCLRPTFFSAISCIDAWMPNKWDIIDFSNPDLLIQDHQTIPLGCRVRPLYFLPHTSLYRCLSIQLYNYAYLLTRAAGERLLARAYPIRMPADELKGRIYFNQLKIYTLFPALTSTHLITSTIAHDRKDHLKRLQKQEPLRAHLLRYLRTHIYTFGVCITLGLRYSAVRAEWKWRCLRFFTLLPLRITRCIRELLKASTP